MSTFAQQETEFSNNGNADWKQKTDRCRAIWRNVDSQTVPKHNQQPQLSTVKSTQTVTVITVK